jgi:hypothetical protein
MKNPNGSQHGKKYLRVGSYGVPSSLISASPKTPNNGGKSIFELQGTIKIWLLIIKVTT